jgi:ATP-dependent Clp protease ATP-binding subunit ClpX
MKAVEQILLSRPDLARYSNVIRINANVLADEKGSYGNAVLSRLYASARRRLGPGAPLDEVLRRVERGIVFIDEVDKIRGEVKGAPNVRGIVAQESLLTLMENENVEFLPDGEESVVTINSSSILFVAGGAFEELYDDVYRRATLGTDVAPLKPVVIVSDSGDVREEMPFHLREYIRYDDLFRYGLAPQFVSRFESVIVLNELTETDLATIFIEPERSLFRTSREYFSRFGVDLQITRGAVRAIAWEAARQKRLGARALAEIFRRVVRGLEYDPLAGSRPGEEGKRLITIDEQMVRAAARATGGTGER